MVNRASLRQRTGLTVEYTSVFEESHCQHLPLYSAGLPVEVLTPELPAMNQDFGYASKLERRFAKPSYGVNQVLTSQTDMSSSDRLRIFRGY